MKVMYNKLKGVTVDRGYYTGVVCGYKPNMIILAVENLKGIKDRTWRRLDKYTVVEDQYKDKKYRYIYEDVDYILKQEGKF